jgi:hypothetical protein
MMAKLDGQNREYLHFQMRQNTTASQAIQQPIAVTIFGAVGKN